MLWWLSGLCGSLVRSNIPFPIWGRIPSPSFCQFDGSGDKSASFWIRSIVLNSHFLLDFQENREELDGCFFEERIPFVADNADVGNILTLATFLGQL